jgi:hypothetical protein
MAKAASDHLAERHEDAPEVPGIESVELRVHDLHVLSRHRLLPRPCGFKDLGSVAVAIGQADGATPPNGEDLVIGLIVSWPECRV